MLRRPTPFRRQTVLLVTPDPKVIAGYCEDLPSWHVVAMPTPLRALSAARTIVFDVVLVDDGFDELAVATLIADAHPIPVLCLDRRVALSTGSRGLS